MGCAASAVHEPSVEQDAARAMQEVARGHQAGPFASAQTRNARGIEAAIAMQADPRIQAMQAKAMQNAMNNPAMQAQMQQISAMLGNNPQMAAPMFGNPQMAVPMPVEVAAMPVEVTQPQDAATRILKLKELLDADAITQAEFDSKKQELLRQV